LMFVTPVSMYIQTNLFSNTTEFHFRKHLVCPSDYFLSNSTEFIREIFTIEKEIFSSLTVYSDKSETLVKEFRRRFNSQITFSGYIHCRPNLRVYTVPAVWHLNPCQTSKETPCDTDVLPNDDATLVELLHGPYIESSVELVTFSLISGIGAAAVFIGLVYLVDQIRHRIQGSIRVLPLVE
jgi:hypothetical protein